MTDSGQGPLSTHSAHTTHTVTPAHQGRKEVCLPFVVSLCPCPSLWVPFHQLPVHLLNSQALLICGRLESTPKWEVWPPVENLWTLALNLGPWLSPLTTRWAQDGSHAQVAGSFRLSQQVRLAGDRGVCSGCIQEQERKAWGQRGDLRLALPHLAHSYFHLLALWHPPSRARHVPGCRERPHVQSGHGQGA